MSKLNATKYKPRKNKVKTLFLRSGLLDVDRAAYGGGINKKVNRIAIDVKHKDGK